MTKPSDLVTEESAANAPVPEQPNLNVTRVVKDEDNDGKADTNEPKTTMPVYLVGVERSNNEKIGAEAFGYEIPVLRALHGDQAITFPGYPVDADVDDVEPIYEATIDGDANSVLQVLRNKYNSPQTGDVVMRVYRDADELASKAGIVKQRGKAKGVKASENTDNRKKK